MRPRRTLSVTHANGDPSRRAAANPPSRESLAHASRARPALRAGLQPIRHGALPNPLSAVEIIGTVAGRLPPSPERRTLPKLLVSPFLISKRPSRMPPRRVEERRTGREVEVIRTPASSAIPPVPWHSTSAAFPLPANRTQRADFPNWALIRDHALVHAKLRRPPRPTFPTALRPAARKAHVYPDSASGLRPSPRRARFVARARAPDRRCAPSRNSLHFHAWHRPELPNRNRGLWACQSPPSLSPSLRLSRTTASLRRHYPAFPVLRASPPHCGPELALFCWKSAGEQDRSACLGDSPPCAAGGAGHPSGRDRIPPHLSVRRPPVGPGQAEPRRPLGLRIDIFEACSAFTRTTACTLAEPPTAALSSAWVAYL